MPEAVVETALKRKRKAVPQAAKKRRRSSSDESSSNSGSDAEDEQSKILLLESSILESRKNYNNITTLIDISRKQGDNDDSVQTAVVAAVSLCRVFIRLLASGNLTKKKDASDKDQTIVQWLRERLADYKGCLLSMFELDEAAFTALTLSMRILKAEGEHLHSGAEYTFPTAFFTELVTALVQAEVDDGVRKEFMEKFVGEHDDIRFYVFKSIRDILGNSSLVASEQTLNNLFSLLCAIEGVPESNDQLEDFYVDPPKRKTHALFSVSQHKKQAQGAWLALLKLGMTKDQKKKALEIMTVSIVPWFTTPELLMDFLTDCYNTGGSTSLLALSGVFYLIQERNLDYPLFYPKLYSLLDADILHSKHRSRFFRLLDTFLASSHLPAALVASFVKKLARLTLNAPPSAIVAIVPWMYNILKKHPLCTFMIHRVPRSAEEKAEIESEGLSDPFLPDEQDPMETHAIDSCLWEIVQLQSHYHPNVATIAKIISEQFTKQFYNIEDFLDHSYGSLLDAEISKEVKKPPVVEFMIPKRIFSHAESGSEETDSLLVDLWDFGLP